MKKHIKEMFGIGKQVVAGGLVMSALPSNAVTGNVATGYANFSKVFPVAGKLYGAGFVIKASKSLIKPIKKLK